MCLRLQIGRASGTEKRSMKKLFLTGAAVLALAVQSPAQTDLIARIHFAGANQISADTNSAAFTNEFCSAEAKALENQTLDKLSRFPSNWLKEKIAADAGDGAAQWRPLLDDLLKSEWIFEMRDTASGPPESALAIRLSADRAALWQKNLADVLESWTKISTKKIQDGWELKKHLPPNLVRATYSGGWLVIGCGENELPLSGEILRPFLNLSPRINENSWLSVNLNWPRLAQIFPALEKFDFPKIEMQVMGRDGDFRVNGKLNLSQPLPPLAQWRMPTNTIHEPFASFTAVRGITPWLEKQTWARPYLISPMPDQFFIWALKQVPFQTFAAAPVPDAKDALVKLDAKLLAAGKPNPHSGFLIPVTTELTNNEISWRGVPFASPSVRAVREKSGDFLLGGFFPNAARSQPLPQELFTQLNTPNLVYYHWEITAQRLALALQVSQLLLMVTDHKQFDANSVAGKWVNKIGPTLGSTVIEATETAPNEVTFTRKASGGFTALELLALGSWLEAPNFPGCDLRLPPRVRRPLRPKLPGTPVPMTAPAPAPAH
jgi:hypothetical protein